MNRVQDLGRLVAILALDASEHSSISARFHVGLLQPLC